MRDDTDLDGDLEFGLPPRRDIPQDARERIKSVVDDGIAAPRRSWLPAAGVAAAIALAALTSQVLPDSMRPAENAPGLPGEPPLHISHLEEQTHECAGGFSDARRGAWIPSKEEPGYAQVLMMRNKRTAWVCAIISQNGVSRQGVLLDQENYDSLNDDRPIGLVTSAELLMNQYSDPRDRLILGIATDKVAGLRVINPRGNSARVPVLSGTFAMRLPFDASPASALTIETYDRTGRRLTRGSITEYES